MFAIRIVCRHCKVVHEIGASQEERRHANRIMVANGRQSADYPEANPACDAWTHLPRVNLTALLRAEVL